MNFGNIMNCPNCNTQLKNIKFESQSIDVCSKCGGMWFDKDELYKVVDGLISENNVDCQTSKEAYKNRPPIGLNEEKRFAKKCPRCKTGMQTFNYAYDSNVFLDKCLYCEGIWADKGETEAIAKHILGNPQMDAFSKVFGDAQNERLMFIKKGKEASDLSEVLTSGGGLGFGWPIIPIPLKDDAQAEVLPMATLGILIINIIVFVLQLLFIRANPESYFKFVGVIPSSGFVINRLYSFFTSMFVHANLFHILVNMLYLWIFGTHVEGRIGSLRFTIFYFLCGIIGNVTMCLAHPYLSDWGIGASGAISGVLGAYLMLFPAADLKVLWMGTVRTIPAVFYLLLWITIQLAFGLVVMGAKEGVEAGYWAHIGGFISGLVMIRLFRNRANC